MPAWLEEPFGALQLAFERQRLGHALLIAGPQGVGKRVLASSLVDEVLGGHNPFQRGHPDFYWVEPAEGKVSISVDQIRGICGQLALTSHGGGSKAAVVYPAEAMTLSAANALLKTLEEPTPQTYLILVSHQPGRLPATIRSRCQTYTIPAPPAAVAAAWLQGQHPDTTVDWAPLLRWADGGPYAAMALMKGDFSIQNKELHSEMQAISTGKADPVKIAERWARGDTPVYVDWLGRELKQMVRNLARGNEITDWGQTSLHNVTSNQRMRRLIGQADRLDRLRGLIGGGVNTELALRALLFEFAPGTAGKNQ